MKSIEAESCSDYVYMLVKIPTKYCVSMLMGGLKGMSTLMIIDKRENLEHKYRRRQFWGQEYNMD